LADGPIPLAIVGRPNVGKSTLVNRLIGDERMLTGPEPGLTREAIAIEWKSRGRTWRLIDTAGLRRQAKVADELEKMSAADAYRAIDRAQVVVVVIDGIVGLDKQELTIASRVVEEGRALVIAVNKWDLVDDRAKALAAIEERIAESLPQARGVPVVTLSALTGRHTDRLLPAALKAYERWNRRVPTAALNRWLGRATATHTPPLVRGRPAKLRYAVQIKNRPPTFALFASQQLPDDYMRYLANSLRDKFELAGVPLRLRVRKGDNPYVKD
jgi:GTP-binding protein